MLSSLVAFAAIAQSVAVAIENVTLVVPGQTKAMEGQTVVVQGGVFTAVAKGAKVPAGAKRIDGTGKYLIPGLWDMHVHWYDESALGLFTANGVTGIRSMWGMDVHKDWKRRGVGPRIVTAGPIVDGPDPVWEGSASFVDPERAGMFVLNHRASEWDFIKVYSLLRRGAYFALMAEAKSQGVPVAGHVPLAVSLLEAAKAGHKCNEHLGGFLTDLRPDAEEVRAQVDQALAEEGGKAKAFSLVRSSAPLPTAAAVESYARSLAKEGMWQCPTLVVLRNISQLDKPDFVKDARLKYMAPEFREMWNPANDFRLRDRKAEDWERSRADYEAKQALIAPLKKAGTKFLAGTDCLNPYCFPGFSLHDELALLVEAGLTPTEALEAATLNPARYFGTTKTMGLVKKGLVADCVLLSRDPLADIRNTTSIVAVVQGGRLYERAELDEMLKKNERG
jgi:imidazolonepropionase-like amidohydrolase